MDQETLKLLAKVKVAARKAIGLDIDIERLTNDRKYASDILGKATQSDDETLVYVAITLQDRFGLLKESPPPAANEGEGRVNGEKYMYGARG